MLGYEFPLSRIRLVDGNFRQKRALAMFGSELGMGRRPKEFLEVLVGAASILGLIGGSVGEVAIHFLVG